ncbi:MAG: tetratricopeptide repeat protein [Bacteroidales bacterium]|nr:tetratricopeptide repeat protein [Bacteroidales bacterium]
MQEQEKETQLVEKIKTLRASGKYLPEIIKDLSPDELQLINNAGISYKTILDGKDYDKIYLTSVFFSIIQPDPNKSILCLNELLVEYHNDYVLYRNRGSDRSDLADYKGSIQDYSKAIELNPVFAGTYYNRGLAFYELKQFEMAIQDYSKAIELNPDNAIVYSLRGMVFGELKQHEEAIQDYSKAIELNPAFAGAYNNRGYAFDKLKLYQTAIEDYTKAIELQLNFAEAYNNRGNALDKLKLYQTAIEDYTKAIELQLNFAEAYNNRGNALDKLKQYQLAIEDYTKVIELDSDFAGAYYNRGLVYELLGLHNLCFLDFSSYLYLCIYSQDISNLSKLVDYFEFSYPQNIKIITETFEIEPSSIVFCPFESAIDKIRDFTLLLDFYEAKEHFNNSALLGVKALLYYYLGGSVASYIIYDEELDCGDYKLTSQELYYYALSAKDVNLEHETVIANCICEIAKENDTDYYYLAHLYLLQNSKENAIEAFKKSSSFIFSQIMLAFLIDDENEKEEYLAKLKANHTKEFPALVNAIDSQATDLLQFQPYFHYRECSEAIEDIKTNYEIPIYSCNKPFWETFYLEELERDSINEAINEVRINKLVSQLKEEFTKHLEKNIPENKDEIVNAFSYILKEVLEYEVTDRLDYLKNRIDDGSDFENQLAKVIKHWNPAQPKLYLIFIQYYFLKGIINPEQTFSLFIYLISIFTREKEKNFEKSFDILFNIIMDSGKTILPSLALKTTLGVAKNLKPFVKTFFNDYNEFEIEPISDYHKFKASMWKFIGIEKETLSESQFNQKYKVFEWFDTYKFV